MIRHWMSVAALAATAAAVLAGCSNNTETTSDANAITVDSSDDACTLSADTAPSGTLSFTVTNSGSEVTEFYLIGDDGVRIVGEVENVGPGVSRELVVQASPGSYFAQCKPGMTGDGIRSEFTVTDSGDNAGAAALTSRGDVVRKSLT